jgi:hypothetical protein
MRFCSARGLRCCKGLSPESGGEDVGHSGKRSACCNLALDDGGGAGRVPPKTDIFFSVVDGEAAAAANGSGFFRDFVRST